MSLKSRIIQAQCRTVVDGTGQYEKKRMKCGTNLVFLTPDPLSVPRKWCVLLLQAPNTVCDSLTHVSSLPEILNDVIDLVSVQHCCRQLHQHRCCKVLAISLLSGRVA